MKEERKGKEENPSRESFDFLKERIWEEGVTKTANMSESEPGKSRWKARDPAIATKMSCESNVSSCDSERPLSSSEEV